MAKKSTSILNRARPLSEISLVVTALLYGRSGTGKTTIAGTFPKPLLVLDIGERGTDSLSGEDISTIEINDWSTLEEVFWELKDGTHDYKTVVIDATHSMQALALQEARDIAGKKDKDQTSQRDFGQASGLMNQWIYHFRDLRDQDINVVFLCHDRLREVDSEDDEMILPEMGPRLMPGVAGTLLGAVNLVGYTYIREQVTKSKIVGKKGTRVVEYGLKLGPNSVYATKVRSPKETEVPEFIIDPDYDKLVTVLKGTVSKPANRPSRKIVRKGK